MWLNSRNVKRRFNFLWWWLSRIFSRNVEWCTMAEMEKTSQIIINSSVAWHPPDEERRKIPGNWNIWVFRIKSLSNAVNFLSIYATMISATRWCLGAARNGSGLHCAEHSWPLIGHYGDIDSADLWPGLNLYGKGGAKRWRVKKSFGIPSLSFAVTSLPQFNISDLEKGDLMLTKCGGKPWEETTWHYFFPQNEISKMKADLLLPQGGEKAFLKVTPHSVNALSMPGLDCGVWPRWSSIDLWKCFLPLPARERG